MIDLIGLDLEDAISILKKNGYAWQCKETKPIKKVSEIEDGFPKVVRQTFLEETCLLTICKIPDVFRYSSIENE